MLARSATPFSANIAPIGVVIRNNHEVDGLFSTTLSSVGDTAVALRTTSMPDLIAGFQSLLTRSMENTASAAVNSWPLVKVTPECRVKS